MPINNTPHDSWAEIYDDLYHRSFGTFYTDLTIQTLDFIETLLPQGNSIIDYGAGTGRLTIPLAQKGYALTAIEPSTEMLQQLKCTSQHLI